MKKQTRYLIYFGIGILIYYIFYDGKDSESLDELHGIAPALILGLVVVMMVLRFLKERKEKRDE
ncbi:MAG: phosphate starvation-inducible membrane PsiE [Cyclobacteriaceae bacterium]|jgi:phosphate starvation-inducible membrane PsiE